MSASFALDARRGFDALARQFGMSCVVSNDREVCYESAKTFLTINFDNGRSYELGIEIGRKTSAKPERPVSLAEVLRLRGLEEAAVVDGMMVSDAVRLPEALARLAKLTSQHAADFLMGSDFLFAQVAKLQKVESAAYALEGALRFARARSAAAWEKRDHQGVVQPFGPLEEHLTPAEKKRLDYSRRHLEP